MGPVRQHRHNQGAYFQIDPLANPESFRLPARSSSGCERSLRSTTTVTVGNTPYAVAVNPVTNKIYVANYGSASVTVIDGATNDTTTVAAGTNPYSAAVNSLTNKICRRSGPPQRVGSSLELKSASGPTDALVVGAPRRFSIPTESGSHPSALFGFGQRQEKPVRIIPGMLGRGAARSWPGEPG